jgi:hypothetical protein
MSRDSAGGTAMCTMISREGFGLTRIVWNAISPCHQLWLVRTAVCCSRRSTLTYRRWLSGRFGRRFSARVAEGGISWPGTDRGCNDRTVRNAMHRFIIFRGHRTGEATDTQPYPPLHPPPKGVVAQRLWLPSSHSCSLLVAASTFLYGVW